jgi:hypothetical protein
MNYWYLAIIVVLGWALAVFFIAQDTARKWGTTRNPIAWLPFFFAGPLMLAVLVGLIVVLIPIGIVGVAVALVCYPFGTVVHLTPEGLAFVRRVGWPKRTVEWAEIREVQEIESRPYSTYVVILKSGQQLRLPYLPETLDDRLIEQGIRYKVLERNAESNDLDQ